MKINVSIMKKRLENPEFDKQCKDKAKLKKQMQRQKNKENVGRRRTMSCNGLSDVTLKVASDDKVILSAASPLFTLSDVPLATEDNLENNAHNAILTATSPMLSQKSSSVKITDILKTPWISRQKLKGEKVRKQNSKERMQSLEDLIEENICLKKAQDKHDSELNEQDINIKDL